MYTKFGSFLVKAFLRERDSRHHSDAFDRPAAACALSAGTPPCLRHSLSACASGCYLLLFV